MVILDTNVLSELRRPRPDLRVLAWLDAAPEDDIVVAVPTVTEIERGIALLEPKSPADAKAIAGWLDGVLATRRVLPMDAVAARFLGRMVAVPDLHDLAITHSRASRPQLGADLAIAAIALGQGAAVATRNLRDFRRIQQHFPALRLVDPFGPTAVG
jgi:predicted nucleic acid-binding protein